MSYINITDNRTARDPIIDLMRGIAMIMVFLFHYGAYFGAPAVLQFGQMGCQVFFFASGYTSSISYDASGNPVKYWKKRYFSLAPAFYTALILYWGYFGVLKGQEIQVAPLLCNFLLIHGLFPFCNDMYPGAWFIGTLVILYLLHPLLDRAYNKSAWPAHLVTFVGIAGSFILTFVINRLLNGEWVVQNNTYGYFLFLNQIGCYLLGMDLYFSGKSKLSIWLCIGSLAAAIFLFYSGFPLAFALVPALIGLFAYGGYGVLRTEAEKKNIIIKIVNKIGKDTLFIYLTHTFIVWNAVGWMLQMCIRVGITDITLAFFILLVPSVLMTWLVSFVFKKIVGAEKRVLRFSVSR